MQNFIPHAYKIECLSNLHVGSGDNNYGVIDKQVQRDSISLLPVIHASGLKGALREYFEKGIKQPVDPKKIEAIFGSGKDSKEKDNMQQGNFRFLEARLLSIPVRGIDKEPFYRATTSQLIEGFNRMAENFGSEYKIVSSALTDKAKTEFGEATIYAGINDIGEKPVFLSEEIMKEVVQHLPVIARNSLDNGQSENLWYEEIVPRESVFYFFVLSSSSGENDIDFENDFNKYIDGKMIQIGANATVGYGCCKLTKLF